MALVQMALQMERSIQVLKSEFMSVQNTQQQIPYYSDSGVDFQKLNEAMVTLGTAVTLLSTQVKQLKASEEYQKEYHDTYG